MTPRKAVIVGSLIVLGIGLVAIAFFGSMLSHWYVTDELWISGRFGGGHYITYDRSPSAFAYYFGFYGLGVAVGCVCILVAVNGAFLLVRQARRNRRSTE
jgi:hypothetical protein